MKIDISTLKKIEEHLGQFEIGRISGAGNHNYFRFGYWECTDLIQLQEILGYTTFVTQDDIYDDDCGWKYYYTIYERYEWEQLQHKRKEQTEILNI
jgi:hypothetical protein